MGPGRSGALLVARRGEVPDMIELRDVCLSFDGRTDVLSHVSLSLGRGERVVLLGKNGSGKSSLCRVLNGSLAPGEGSVMLDGADVTRAPRSVLSRAVGYVRQDPLSQIVSDLCFDEVAFGPRNLGLSRGEVCERVGWALGACGISGLAGRLTSELSGGQQQLLSLAGVLAMRPDHLVLDEADSHLDQSTRARMRSIVDGAVSRGAAVLEIAHSAAALPGAERVVVLERGRVVWEGRPEDALLDRRALDASGLSDDPLATALGRAVGDGRDLATALSLAVLAPYVPSRPDSLRPARTSGLEARGVSVDYDGAVALEDADLAASGLTLLLGASGSGKTTMARVLAGVLEPDAGTASLDGGRVRPGMVGLSFQRPEDQLFCDTVLDDIAYGPRARGLGDEGALAVARDAAARLDVPEELLGRSPFALSGGQMRRVALAGVIASGPGAYVFDEPGAGLDAPGRGELVRIVRRLAEAGAAVVVITHDAGEWLDAADRVAFVRDGRVCACERASVVSCRPDLFEEAGLDAPLLVRAREAAGGDRA